MLLGSFNDLATPPCFNVWSALTNQRVKRGSLLFKLKEQFPTNLFKARDRYADEAIRKRAGLLFGLFATISSSLSR